VLATTWFKKWSRALSRLLLAAPKAQDPELLKQNYSDSRLKFQQNTRATTYEKPVRMIHADTSSCRRHSMLKNIFAVIFTCYIAIADADNCPRTFTDLAESISTPSEWLDDKVQVVYFPTARHMKLRVDELVYANVCPDSRCEILPLATLDRLSSSLSSGPRFTINIRVTKNELNALKEYVEQGRFGNAIDCSHSVCRALNKTTGAWVPMPLSLSPAAAALTLTFSKYFNNSRVVWFNLKMRKGEGPDALTEVVLESAVVALGGVAAGGIALLGVLHFVPE